MISYLCESTCRLWAVALAVMGVEVEVDVVVSTSVVSEILLMHSNWFLDQTKPGKQEHLDKLALEVGHVALIRLMICRNIPLLSLFAKFVTAD